MKNIYIKKLAKTVKGSYENDPRVDPEISLEQFTKEFLNGYLKAQIPFTIDFVLKELR